MTQVFSCEFYEIFQNTPVDCFFSGQQYLYLLETDQKQPPEVFYEKCNIDRKTLVLKPLFNEVVAVMGRDFIINRFQHSYFSVFTK